MKDPMQGPWASDKLDLDAFLAAYRARRARAARDRLLHGEDQAAATPVFDETDRDTLRRIIYDAIGETPVALSDERAVMLRMFELALEGSIHGGESLNRVRPDSWQALADTLDRGRLQKHVAAALGSDTAASSWGEDVKSDFGQAAYSVAARARDFIATHASARSTTR